MRKDKKLARTQTRKRQINTRVFVCFCRVVFVFRLVVVLCSNQYLLILLGVDVYPPSRSISLTWPLTGELPQSLFAPFLLVYAVTERICCRLQMNRQLLPPEISVCRLADAVSCPKNDLLVARAFLAPQLRLERALLRPLDNGLVPSFHCCYYCSI